MKECYNKGYSIVIITNKSKLFTGDQLLNVMNELRKKYKIKYAIAYFTFNKEWRKPNTKMFEAHLKMGSSKHMSLPKLDKKQSFMVGDALGRPHDWSDLDKQFAKNCGMTIVSPETFFEMKPPKPATDIKLPDISLKTTQEVILMMGYPGSGKSTITKIFEEDKHYEVIHGDDYKSNKSKMKKKMKEIISSGKSPVIDATNPSKKARAIFIDIAKENDLDVRVIRMTTTIEESMERNALREKKVPKIALYMYRKNYEEPTKDEGIHNVIEV
jgi:bifunctional polynucleotide phosphatase/kinase